MGLFHASQGRRRPGIPPLAICGLLLFAAARQSQAQSASPADEDRESVIVSPTLGRPSILQPGGVLTLVLADALDGELQAALIQPHGGHRYPLAAEAGPDGTAPGTLRVRVPENIPQATYDLSLRNGTQVWANRHCVAVQQIGGGVRLVHLADLQLGDPCVDELPQGLIDELNLVAPNLVVLSGNLVSRAHPQPRRALQRLLERLSELNAPMMAACGAEDDIKLYSELLAPSPIGQVRVGDHVGLVLLDTPAQPLAGDKEQIAWLGKTLSQSAQAASVFLVSGDGRVRQSLVSNPALREAAVHSRVRAWLIPEDARDGRAGSNDTALHGKHPAMMATPPATPLPTGSSSLGVYRIVDLGPRATRSVVVPVGSLAQRVKADADRTPALAETTVINRCKERMSDLYVSLRVAKTGDAKPWVQGGTLVQLTDALDAWECRVQLSVPDRSSATVRAGTGPAPAEPRIRARWETAPAADAASARGLGPVADRAAVLRIENLENSPVNLSPRARLAGQWVPLRMEAAGPSPEPASNDAVAALPPGAFLRLRPDWSALSVPAGEYELLIYPLGSATGSPLVLPARVHSSSEVSSATSQPASN